MVQTLQKNVNFAAVSFVEVIASGCLSLRKAQKTKTSSSYPCRFTDGGVCSYPVLGCASFQLTCILALPYVGWVPKPCTLVPGPVRRAGQLSSILFGETMVPNTE